MSTSPSPFAGLYLEGELAPTPPTEPLRKPSVVSSTIKSEDGTSLHGSRQSFSSTTALRNKHESYNLSGSVFLITSDGTTLKLPVPSDSPADPLGWGRWKRIGAFLAVYWYSTITLTSAQAASMMFQGISREFEVGPSTNKVPTC